MEKYGVEELEEAVKTAQSKDRCPVCGTKLELLDNVNVLKCPKCGTKPFEESHE